MLEVVHVEAALLPAPVAALEAQAMLHTIGGRIVEVRADTEREKGKG